MTNNSRLSVPWAIAVAGAVLLTATGAGTTYLLMRRTPAAPGPPPPAAHSDAAAHQRGGQAGEGPRRSDAPPQEIAVTLADDAIARARIVVEAVTAGTATARLRIPSVIEPNAYRQVAVTPLVGGRVTRVLAELGGRVRAGQTLAEIYSPELAAAQQDYRTFLAEFDAAHQQLLRTERLAEIGAASRQDLERVRAQHTAHATHVEAARSRLVLLGIPREQLDEERASGPLTAATRVPAPISGVVTERSANPGLNVDPSTRLFTVVDLSSLWVVGDLHERDVAQVRTGSRVTIVPLAYPNAQIEGRIEYLDPQVAPATRTARIRAEVPNREGRLRIGMYADMLVDQAGDAPAIVVPRSAIQSVAGAHVVYVSDARERGRFVQRTVEIGTTRDETVEILSGINPGDRIVTAGSFYVRAEIERLGLTAGESNAPVAVRTPTPAETAATQVARVLVTDKGYEPARLTLRAGVPARITFVRTSERTCGTEVSLPEEGIRRTLPLNQPVTVELTPRRPGELAFVCGMNMLRGVMTVR